MKTKHSLGYINRYETKLLFRQRWLQLTLSLMTVLIIFAIYNGKQKVNQRSADINNAISLVEKNDSLAIVLLDSIEAGFTIDVPSWNMPNRPNTFGYTYPRVATMPPSDMAAIATGQSDIYAHIIQTNLYSETFEANYTSISNPVQLMFGNFDLSFVLIYLLPLIVIAFTYNILSEEREHGILHVIASQPLALQQWLLRKALIRYVLFSGLLVLILIVSLSVAGLNPIANIGQVITFFTLLLGYVLFWFVLAFLVNLRGNSSANNAIWLISAWVFLILLIPSVVNLAANSLYPAPSRANLINEYRIVKVEAEKKADETLQGYLRDHPELAGFEGGSQGWMKFFATQDLIKREVEPVMTGFEQEVKERQDWVEGLRFISPSLLLQSSFNEIAGTSTRHYKSFRDQEKAFTQTWKDYFIPKTFRGEMFTKAMVSELPKFTYTIENRIEHSATNMVVLMVYCLLLLLTGVLWSKQRTAKLLFD